MTEGRVNSAPTSSLFDILARLALSVEPPSSLCATWEAWFSSAGRGIPEGLLNCRPAAAAAWLR
jgi:hypothetical protein